jgi:hypothetical protein
MPDERIEHQADAVSDGWVQITVADSEASGLAALLADPALTVVVRPDRVVASVARRRYVPPPLPWSARSLPLPTPIEITV